MSQTDAAASDLRRRGALLIAVAIGGFTVDYLFNAGLGRLLDPHQYGDFRVAWSFASLVAVLVLLGGDRAMPQALAGPFDRGEVSKVWEYLRFYFAVALALSAVAMGGTWLISAFHTGSSDPMDHHAMAWAVIGVPISAAGALASRALQSARYPARANLPWRLGVPLLNLAFVSALLITGSNLEVQGAVLFAVFAVLLVTGWQWISLRRLKLPRLERQPAARTPKTWLTASVPMMGVFLVALALNQSDLYFLELLGEEHEVGHYAAAATTAHLILIVQTALVGLTAPHVQLALERGLESAQDVLRRGQRSLLATLVPSLVIMFLAAGPLLALFGGSFDDAVPTLRLLLLGNFIWATAALTVLWLQYTGRALYVVGITIATLVLDSIANVILVPQYGMEGAAASTAATTLLATVAVFIIQARSAVAVPKPSVD
ncbi:MAG: oligosaccharide flippase family protein [Thermoanaerobaculia bacterium]|nr:oligosaccharide flippase family protein [Thermoanaerobaculia bacterium]